MKQVVVFDYGFGNVRSVCRALAKVGVKAGVEVTLSDDFDAAMNAAGLVVPGVGAFGACMQGLRAKRGDEIVKARAQQERPVLGICVGHQILFESSSESEGVPGLGLVAAQVERIEAQVVPHMGWNEVLACNAETSSPSGALAAADGASRVSETYNLEASPPTLAHLPEELRGLEGERFYFVHSYAALEVPAGLSAAYTTHEDVRFVSAVKSGAVLGVQFHPEKSGAVGLNLLERWVGSSL